MCESNIQTNRYDLCDNTVSEWAGVGEAEQRRSIPCGKQTVDNRVDEIRLCVRVGLVE